jgi:hypothetical protein
MITIMCDYCIRFITIFGNVWVWRANTVAHIIINNNENNIFYPAAIYTHSCDDYEEYCDTLSMYTSSHSSIHPSIHLFIHPSIHH